MRDSRIFPAANRHGLVARLALTAGLLLVIFAPLPLTAQRLGDLRVGLEQRSTTGEHVVLGLTSESRSHWKTGFVLGTIVGAAGWALFAGSSGEGSFSASDALISVGLGALLGGVPGSLIGSMFPRGP